MSALITYGAAALFFLVGVRVGRRWSGVLLGALALAAVAFSLVARLEEQSAQRDFGVVMLSTFFAVACALSALTLVGPMIFEKWLGALALSVVVVVGVLSALTAPMVACVITGVCE